MTDQSHASHSRALTGAAVLFFLVGLVVLAWNIPLPMVAYSPGPVSDASNAVIVDSAPVYAPSGELLMLTVESQTINAFEAVVAAIDPTVDVLARNVVRRPDESDEEFRRRNLQLMDQSTATAIGVALSNLGLTGEDGSVFITGYAADTPAGQVLEIGDAIVEVDGTTIASTDDLAGALAGREPGDTITIVIARGESTEKFDIELAASTEEPDRPFIGIFVRQLPFWIDLDPGIVGGPSAGMMYTLAIIEVLSEGDLTHGHVVAGTGTIDAEGNVGGIGGVRQKVVGAEAAGAEYMLLPRSNYEAALTAPRTSMELVPVDTIHDALAFLDSLAAG